VQETTIPFRVFYPPASYLGVETGVYKRLPATKVVSNNEMYLNKANITDNRTAPHSQQQYFLGRQN
jgi:hypothetical protein